MGFEPMCRFEATTAFRVRAVMLTALRGVRYARTKTTSLVCVLRNLRPKDEILFHEFYLVFVSGSNRTFSLSLVLCYTKFDRMSNTFNAYKQFDSKQKQREINSRRFVFVENCFTFQASVVTLPRQILVNCDTCQCTICIKRKRKSICSRSG